MPSDETRPIIIKRKTVAGGGGHHGGAWKVAYADFVTAMMAFFLLMWLLNATTEEQRKGLADYFNPTIPVSRNSAGGGGLLEGRSLLDTQRLAGSADKGVPPKPSAAAAAPDDRKPPPDARPKDRQQEDLPPGEAAPAPAGSGTGAPKGTPPPASAAPDGASQAAAGNAARQAELERIGREIAACMKNAQDGTLERHFLLRLTPEGLVIEVIDADDQPLFASASAEPAAILPTLIDVLVPVLNQTTNDIAVVGHTDAVPYGGANYSNWELSADRANAARRLLTGHGLPESRIARVTGKAAVDPLVPDRNAPQNRRTAITLLRDQPR